MTVGVWGADFLSNLGACIFLRKCTYSDIQHITCKHTEQATICCSNYLHSGKKIVVIRNVLKKNRDFSGPNFLLPLVNLIMLAKGFGDSHTKFGVLLSRRGLDVTGLFFLSDLVGACIFQENVPIETFNISFESTQN